MSSSFGGDFPALSVQTPSSQPFALRSPWSRRHRKRRACSTLEVEHRGAPMMSARDVSTCNMHVEYVDTGLQLKRGESVVAVGPLSFVAYEAISSSLCDYNFSSQKGMLSTWRGSVGQRLNGAIM